MSLAPGTRLAHYEILARLGAGGMGEVYRATDAALGRQVALKVLPAGLAHDPARIDRFRREARTVAALNHPHIVTIYSVEESGGVHFLTMELVEGKPLDQAMPSKGFPADALLGMALPLADALAAARDRGMVRPTPRFARVLATAKELAERFSEREAALR